jgi:hypothetical protein
MVYIASRANLGPMLNGSGSKIRRWKLKKISLIGAAGFELTICRRGDGSTIGIEGPRLWRLIRV